MPRQLWHPRLKRSAALSTAACSRAWRRRRLRHSWTMRLRWWGRGVQMLHPAAAHPRLQRQPCRQMTCVAVAVLFQRHCLRPWLPAPKWIPARRAKLAVLGVGVDSPMYAAQQQPRPAPRHRRHRHVRRTNRCRVRWRWPRALQQKEKLPALLLQHHQRLLLWVAQTSISHSFRSHRPQQFPAATACSASTSMPTRRSRSRGKALRCM